MFLSWISQNQFSNSFAAERLRLERSQLAIDLQQMRMEQWQSLYMQEKSKPEPNRSTLTVAAFKSLQSYTNLVTWSFARVSDNPEADILARNNIQENLTKSYQAGNLKALEDEMQKVAAIESNLQIADGLTKKFVAKMMEIKKSERWYTTLFVSTYVIGTLLLAVQFLLKFRKELRPDNA